MRTIIAGSRTITDIDAVRIAMCRCGWTPSLVLSGTARGADRLGEQWAEENNIPVARFPADWYAYGKRAGYIRNELMSDNADALVALWDMESRGTKHMIKVALSRKLRVFVWTPPALKIVADQPVSLANSRRSLFTTNTSTKDTK